MTKNIKNAAIFHRILESIDKKRIRIYTRSVQVANVTEGSDCIIRDGYVYVSVAPAEEVQNVKINYYDEDAEKQVAEVPVQVSIDTSCCCGQAFL